MVLAGLVLLAGGVAGVIGPTSFQVLNETSPRLCDDVEQFAGYFHLRTGPGSKHYFYWHFASRNAPKDDPVVLWLTGGPGCSSEVALFGENGPCKVNKDGTATTRNPYSWNFAANLLYVDQPTGTGFSYGSGYDHDEKGVANDMYDFLLQFFAKHTELADNDLYIFGESYAGHYVPAIAHRVWRGNKEGGTPRLQLRGVAVGNGLTDPEVQYAYYPDMAISTNGHKPAVGSLTHAAMKLALPACLATIRACNAANSSMADAACAAAQTGCNAAEVMPYQTSGLNVYDMRIPCEVPGLCYDFSNIGKYLARAEVRRALNIDPAHADWADCNMAVNMMFRADWMKDYQQRLPDLLNDGIRVLIYAGDQVRARRPPPRARGTRTRRALTWTRAALLPARRRSAGLHLQLAGQQGVDPQDGVAGPARLRACQGPALDRAHRRVPWQAGPRGRCALSKGPHLPAHVQCGAHGADGPARGEPVHARPVPGRQAVMRPPHVRGRARGWEFDGHRHSRGDAGTGRTGRRRSPTIKLSERLKLQAESAETRSGDDRSRRLLPVLDSGVESQRARVAPLCHHIRSMSI